MFLKKALIVLVDCIWLLNDSLKAGNGYAVAQLAAALRYKQEGCAFDPRWGYWDF
jgi:hypothetical protein